MQRGGGNRKRSLRPLRCLMVDMQKPSSSRRPARRPQQSSEPARPKGTPSSGGQSSTPVFILGGASIVLIALGAGVFYAWASVTDAAAQVWGAMRWTWPVLAVWAAALPIAFMKRPDLVKRHPHRWAAGLLLVAAAAGCLQLYGQGLGGAFGGLVVGGSAAWGIVRTAAIFTAAFAMAAPMPAAWAGRILLIGLGFFAVYLWMALGVVFRGLHAVGVWIGLKCTEVSPSLARGAAAAWRGVGRAYGKFPVHLYIVAALVIATAFVLRRPAPERRRPSVAAAAYEAYPYPLGVFEDAAGRAEAAARPAVAAPARASTAETAVEAPPYERPAWTQAAVVGAPAPPTPTPPAYDEDADDDAAAYDVVEEAEDADEDADAGPPPFALYDEEGEDEDAALDALDDFEEFEEYGETEFIDLRSEAARSGGLIAAATGSWELPPLDLLKSVPPKEVSEETHQATARLIEQTLAEYGIEVAVKEIRPGPVVTQYGVVPGWVRRYKDVKERNPDGTPAKGPDGRLLSRRVEEKTRVRVDHVLAREKDLALALAAESLRFEASVPGQSYMGLEVPNAERGVVTLRSSLESSAFQSMQQKAKLPVALGLGSGGEAVMADLADMPHLLIAGSTGSGKSVCMNVIICSLMMQCTPQDLQMYLVDPKRVELTGYNGLPHLAGPVLVEVDQAVPALHALIAEMQSRYKKFEARGARNIVSYNGKLARGEERMPYLLLVIDELADLMMTVSGDVEPALCRLAQLGRAAGIHLVIATQRPSVNVITGLIKANFPSRISFAVSSQVDARTVLDSAGAEKLLGRGDLLFMSANAAKPRRLQGAFISEEEVDAIVSFWRTQKGGPRPTLQMEIAEPENEEDAMLLEAQKLATSHSRISASLLQRKLGIGYAKAASLLDHLEDRGIVGPGDPGKSREVITPGRVM